jgi:hypothetical protein
VPQAHSACANGLRTGEWTRGIAGGGQHGGSEVASARHSQWQGHWRRGDEGAQVVRSAHPESCRAGRIRGRQGDATQVWACTKVVRLKRSGRQRLVIVHAQAQLEDAPRGLRTEAPHWASGRGMAAWR